MQLVWQVYNKEAPPLGLTEGVAAMVAEAAATLAASAAAATVALELRGWRRWARCARQPSPARRTSKPKSQSGRRSEAGEPGLGPDPAGAPILELSSDWGTASSTARHLLGYKMEAKARAEEFGQNPELRGTPLGSGYCQLSRQAPSGV